MNTKTLSRTAAARPIPRCLPVPRVARRLESSRFAMLRLAATCFIVSWFAASAASAQPCGERWLPGDGYPGVNGVVYDSVEWDPDGDGPMTPKIVLGGGFNAAGTIAVRNIATYDRATGEWGTLGNGFDKTVWALAVLADGSLVAAGEFTAPKGLARWNGTAWVAFGSGLTSTYPGVSKLLPLADGSLVAAGYFTATGADGGVVKNIGICDGVTWHLMGETPPSYVHDAVLHDGDIVAAGSFFVPSLGQSRSVVRWDGAAWQAVGEELNSTQYKYHSTRALAVDLEGRLISAGGVSDMEYATHIYRWDGEAWSELGAGISGKYPHVDALAVSADGTVYAGGWFLYTNNEESARSVMRWNGGDWKVVAYTDGGVASLTAMSTGEVVVGGWFRDEGIGAGIIENSNSSGWSVLGDQGNSTLLMGVNSILALPDGDVIVYAYDEYTYSERIWRWDGLRWTYSGLSGEVRTWLAMPDGDVLLGGNMYNVGYLAKGRGKTWTTFAPGLSGGSVRRLARLPNGDILACGEFTKAGNLTVNRIARWDGTKWNALGTGLDGYVGAIAVMPDGQVYAGGEFTTAGGKSAKNIARWDGVEWHAIGAGTTGPVRDMVVMPNGDLIVGGLFGKIAGVTASSVARWNGSVWSKMGSGFNDEVRELAVTPGGGVVAAGRFSTQKYVARWDGTKWNPLGTGTDGQYPQISAMDVTPDGDILVGGWFETAGGLISPNFARWTATGAPMKVLDPTDQFIDVFFDAEFSATSAKGYENVSVQWLRNGVPIMDGPGGASEGGGTVEGATGALASPTNGTPATLRIRGVRSSDAGEYSARFFNDCGEAVSESAALKVPCLADLDATGFVDTDDFDAFTKAFEEGALAADMDRSGFVDTDDFDLFMRSFEAGC